MAIAYVIKNKIDGKSISIGEALKKSFSRWGATIGTNIILGIFILGLTLLLIFPGIIYIVYWVFAPLAVILNNKFGKDALNYSKSIVKGRWWTVAVYSTIFVLLEFAVGIIGEIPYWFLPQNFFTNITANISIDILLSFFTVVSTIFYINFNSTKKADVIK